MRLHCLCGTAAFGGVLRLLPFPIARGWNSSLNTERAGHTCNAADNLRAIHQHLFFRWLVSRNRFKRDMWDDSAHLFALVVLPTVVDKSPRGTPRFVFQLVIIESGREQTL